MIKLFEHDQDGIKVIKTKEDIAITNAVSKVMNLAGVATFNENILLYRGTTASELYDVIVNNRKMTGGIFSSNVERRIGASFAYDKNEAIKALSKPTILYIYK